MYMKLIFFFELAYSHIEIQMSLPHWIVAWVIFFSVLERQPKIEAHIVYRLIDSFMGFIFPIRTLLCNKWLSLIPTVNTDFSTIDIKSVFENFPKKQSELNKYKAQK